MRDSFKDYHPLVNFIYFIFVIGFSIFIMHPVCLAISFITSFNYSVMLSGRKKAGFAFISMITLVFFAIFINPLFNHQGATILFYFKNGNPLTLESIIYGIAAAFMLISVILWFSCYNQIMSSDKFIYLFGRIIPSLSLIFTMTLRFVPNFTAQLKKISNTQKCLGREISRGSIIKRAKSGISILSIMITWALENAIITADSMKCRGYGLRGRTNFSLFKFTKRDYSILIFIFLCALYIIAGSITGGIYSQYYPVISFTMIKPYTISIFLCYAALCVIPLYINIWEDRKWNALKSGI